MFREHVIFRILFTLTLIAGFLFLYQNQELGTVLSLGSALITTFFIYSLTVRIRMFYKLNSLSAEISISKIPFSVENRFTKCRKQVTQIIKAIEKIESSEFLGATILGNGTVVLMLDANKLIRKLTTEIKTKIL